MKLLETPDVDGILRRFRELAEEAGARRQEALAKSLLLLMDGAYVVTRMFGPSAENPAVHLADAVRQIIQEQVSKK